jgi:putative spermidine/putrescine transport system permease protein
LPSASRSSGSRVASTPLDVIVTYFTAGANNTLPLLILGFIRQGQQLPVVNVVVLVVILLTSIPVIISVRLTRDTGTLRRR